MTDGQLALLLGVLALDAFNLDHVQTSSNYVLVQVLELASGGFGSLSFPRWARQTGVAST